MHHTLILIKSKFFGPKEFYARVTKVAVPSIFQQLLLTTFGIADTIMVGSIVRGVEGVGIAAQIEGIINVTIYGLLSGIGIYIAQFYGSKEKEKVRNCFAFGIIVILAIVGLLGSLVYFFPNQILGIYTQDSEVIAVAKTYIMITLFSYLPNMISFCFSMTYRNIQKTHIPLIISLVASSINIIFNYLLIFGVAGFPKLGVAGAAIATVLSTSVGCLIHIVYSFATKQFFLPKLKNFFGAFNKEFIRPVFKRVRFLILNELMFSLACSLLVIFINKIDSDSYGGYRIAETLANIMYSISFGMSIAVGALMGQAMGNKEFVKADKYGSYFVSIAFIGGLVMASVCWIFTVPLVNLFNSNNPNIVQNAYNVMHVMSLRIFLRFFVVLIYAVFRSGGQTKFVAFLDSGIMWLFGMPLAWLLIDVIKIKDVALFYLLYQLESILRMTIGLIAFRKKIWNRNLTEEVKLETQE